MMMLRTFALGALASAATAAHLSGPVDDRMNACFEANCPAFSGFMAAPDFQGTGMPFSTFVSPPMNSVPFIYDMPYAIAVLGLDGNASAEFTYRDTAGQPQNLTATATTDYSDMFECVCTSCGSSVEAIFQPIGRAICTSIGVDLPCQDEFDACKTANAGTGGYTGSLAGRDLVYPAVGGGGDFTASTDPCHPEAAFFGYKVAYNLTEDCNADGTALTAGGGPTALELAKCVAVSRIEAYRSADGVDYNCLVDVGGPDCGEPYVCTYVEPAEPEDADPSTSGCSTATVAVSSIFALVAANLLSTSPAYANRRDQPKASPLATACSCGERSTIIAIHLAKPTTLVPEFEYDRLDLCAFLQS